MFLETRLVSSLEKIFTDEVPTCRTWTQGSALRGEIYSFQLLACPDQGVRVTVSAAVDSPLAPYIQLYVVRQVPVTLPVYPWSDDHYLRTKPGLFPDLLMPYTDSMPVVIGQWRSLWVEVRIPEDIAPGNYPIRITLTSADDTACHASETFQLEVLAPVLPAQTLIHTEWFHNDCLAVHYKVPVFSEEHWTLIENYMAAAARYGMNMILVPLFTPPLDTAVGGERPTVQLVDVIREEGYYRFGFDRLKRYLDLAARCGMQYFEMSHLFTQWGAKAAPKILVQKEDGTLERLFGWDTPATSPEYTTFLQAFLPALQAFLRQEGRLDQSFFHLSDEPSLEHLESYRAARESVRALLDGCRVIDALSDYDFYQQGLVPHPIPSVDRAAEFLDHGVRDLWTYYCCGQVQQVSNRMTAMPSARNRILGWQLFKFEMKGFLHWGYNFWFTRFSHHAIDPFFCTDAEDAFPSGDPFLVYPGEDGHPLPSIRQLVFQEALQDMRALQLLEQRQSHKAVSDWLDSLCREPLTFSAYPRETDWILEAREAVNRKLAELEA